MPDTLTAAEPVSAEPATSYPSLARRRAALRDRLAVRDDVANRRQDARRFLAAGLDMIERGMEAKADLAFLSETATGLHDALTRLMAGMRSDLDNCGADDRDADIDMGELDQLITTLERGR
ncbi:MAG: hypothetical protein K0R61_35 [Microvirga sp.]|jgi:hypothetical protein|nr:hypothetical protein [Microvirga sp.]MDF2969585.1 hypothetical protein [Microvirga sp.]